MKRRLILSAIPLAALVVAGLGVWLMPEHKTVLICVAMGVCLVCNAIKGVRHGD